MLVLDGPTNHLDIAAQLELLEMVRSLGLTVVAALHNLNLAATVDAYVGAIRQARSGSGRPQRSGWRICAMSSAPSARRGPGRTK